MLIQWLNWMVEEYVELLQISGHIKIRNNNADLGGGVYLDNSTATAKMFLLLHNIIMVEVSS